MFMTLPLPISSWLPCRESAPFDDWSEIMLGYKDTERDDKGCEHWK